MSPWDTVPYRHYQHFNTSERQVVEGCERSTKEVSSKSTLFSNTDPEEPGRRQVHGQVPQHQLPPGERLVLLRRRRWRQKGRIQSEQALRKMWFQSNHTKVTLFTVFIPKIAHEKKPTPDVMFHLVRKIIKCCFGQRKGPMLKTWALTFLRINNLGETLVYCKRMTAKRSNSEHQLTQQD